MDGPVSGEVKANTKKREDMVAEGRDCGYPPEHGRQDSGMTAEGLKAVKDFQQKDQKRTQRWFLRQTRLLAARRARPMCPRFSGRLDDISTTEQS